jgi:hypothetical protein
MIELSLQKVGTVLEGQLFVGGFDELNKLRHLCDNIWQRI